MNNKLDGVAGDNYSSENGEGPRRDIMNFEVKTITKLPALIDAMIERDKTLIRKIFDISESKGTIIYPEDPVVIRGYGVREEVEEQKIIKITNKITYECSLFNELRSRRPFQTKEQIELNHEIERTDGCIFCLPKAYYVTSGDTFLESGRIKKKTCFTASNPAKYDGYHGLVIFNDHNPYYFVNFQDFLSCSIEWAKNAQKKDVNAIYFFFMWNCLWKAGGSIIHGHTQMSLSKGKHYGKIEFLLQAANSYGKNYFKDIYNVHRILGLGFKVNSVKLMAYLTPIKEKEILMMAESIDDLCAVIPRVLECLYHRLGVRSFNLALICSPSAIFDEIDEKERERWKGFPIMVRIVDRGSLNNRTTDIGAMELYAASVISSDPYIIVRELETAFDIVNDK
jgi:hypothetical protein